MITIELQIYRRSQSRQKEYPINCTFDYQPAEKDTNSKESIELYKAMLWDVDISHIITGKEKDDFLTSALEYIYEEIY